MEDGSWRRELATESNFDEEAYLAANPDVAQAISQGKGFQSGRHHFDYVGRREGRKLLWRSGEVKESVPTASPGSRRLGLYPDLRSLAEALSRYGFRVFIRKVVHRLRINLRSQEDSASPVSRSLLSDANPDSWANGSGSSPAANPFSNPGIVYLNQADKRIYQKTIIVVGVPRSGTSMVASALVCLGVFMGHSIDRAVFEDVDIANALESGETAKLKTLIENRNRSYRLWGFKRPAAFKIMDSYVHLFRNPCFIITYRDPLAIAKRNEISMGVKFAGALLEASNQLSALTQFALKLRQPTMLISYEKALLDPMGFVNNLAEFCAVEADAGLIETAANTVENGPELYLRESRIKSEDKGRA